MFYSWLIKSCCSLLLMPFPQNFLVSKAIINSFNKNALTDALFLNVIHNIISVAVMEISPLFFKGGMWVGRAHQLSLNSISIESQGSSQKGVSCLCSYFHSHKIAFLHLYLLKYYQIFTNHLKPSTLFPPSYI